MACSEHRERRFNMSHCRGGDVSPSSLCEMHVIEASSVIFLSPRASVWCLCVCVCVRLGSLEEALLAGRAARLSSLCLEQPLGQSGLSGRSSAGVTSELACRRERKAGERWGRFENSQSCQHKTGQRGGNGQKPQFAALPGRGLEAHELNDHIRPNNTDHSCTWLPAGKQIKPEDISSWEKTT